MSLFLGLSRMQILRFGNASSTKIWLSDRHIQRQKLQKQRDLTIGTARKDHSERELPVLSEKDSKREP